MVLKISHKHPKGFREITTERAIELENAINRTASNFKDANFALSGGLSIPYLLKAYDQPSTLMLKYYSKHGMKKPEFLINVENEIKNSGQEDFTKAFLPSKVCRTERGFYRDHNAIHLACLEGDLYMLVKAAEQNGYKLFHRDKTYASYRDLKLEDYIPVDTETANKIGKDMEISGMFKSNLLRLVRTGKNSKPLINGDILDYYDLFVHHVQDIEGNKLKEENGIYFNPESKEEIEEKNMVVVSNKDGLSLPFENFKYVKSNVAKDLPLNLVNQVYIMKVKFNHSSSDKINPYAKESIDLEILDKLSKIFIDRQSLEGILTGRFN